MSNKKCKCIHQHSDPSECSVKRVHILLFFKKIHQLQGAIAWCQIAIKDIHPNGFG